MTSEVWIYASCTAASCPTYTTDDICLCVFLFIKKKSTKYTITTEQKVEQLALLAQLLYLISFFLKQDFVLLDDCVAKFYQSVVNFDHLSISFAHFARKASLK